MKWRSHRHGLPVDSNTGDVSSLQSRRGWQLQSTNNYLHTILIVVPQRKVCITISWVICVNTRFYYRVRKWLKTTKKVPKWLDFLSHAIFMKKTRIDWTCVLFAKMMMAGSSCQSVNHWAFFYSVIWDTAFLCIFMSIK